MTKAELEKKTKSELFELESKLSKRRVAGKSKEELKQERKMVKCVLYECAYCLYAKTDVIECGGEEREYFIDDCGEKVCPYRGEFLRRAAREQKEIEEMMKIV